MALVPRVGGARYPTEPNFGINTYLRLSPVLIQTYMKNIAVPPLVVKKLLVELQADPLAILFVRS